MEKGLGQPGVAGADGQTAVQHLLGGVGDRGLPAVKVFKIIDHVLRRPAEDGMGLVVVVVDIGANLVGEGGDGLALGCYIGPGIHPAVDDRPVALYLPVVVLEGGIDHLLQGGTAAEKGGVDPVFPLGGHLRIVRQHHPVERGAVGEEVAAHFDDGVGKDRFGQGGAVPKGGAAQLLHTGLYGEGGQSGAVHKGAVAHCFHRAGDGEPGKAPAGGKSVVPDFGNGDGNINGLQLYTAPEAAAADFGQALGQGDVGELEGHPGEGLRSDLGDPFGDGDDGVASLILGQDPVLDNKIAAGGKDRCGKAQTEGEGKNEGESAFHG